MTNERHIDSRLLGMSPQQLLAEIGRSDPTNFADAPDENEYRELGRRWYTANISWLTEVICQNNVIRSVTRRDIGVHEQVVAVCGVLDTVAHLLGHVPVVTVAVLIVRITTQEFCKAVWSSEPAPRPDQQ